MADSATTRNRFRKQEVGAKTNAWGGDWNEDGGSDRLDEALDGVSEFALSGTKTLSSTNYETDESRMRILNITSGTGGTVTIPAVEKWYLVRNNTSGDVIITAGGIDATIPASGTVPVFCNGTNVYASSLSAYVTAAEAAQTAAELAQTGAETAETNAQTAETNAETAETNAEAYAVAAAGSAASAAAAASSVIGTSTTSLLIEVAEKTFTTQSGKNWQVGSYVIAASAADPANFMFGQVTSYSTTTLIVDVQVVGGSGTLADWNISLAGVRGATGATGATGPGASYTVIGTATPTGTATVNFTSIPTTYNDLRLVFLGVSLTGVGPLTTQISGDGNATRCTVSSAFTGGASDTHYGAIEIPGYLADGGTTFSLLGNLTSNTSSSSSNAEGVAWRISGGIDAIRITGGTNFDAGTIILYGK